MISVLCKELKTYFSNMYGYVFCSFILLFSGIYTMVVNLKSGYPNFEYVLGNMTFVFLIAVPVLTMRIISEDRKQKTDRLYYSLPLKTHDVILGKYFAMLCVLALPILIMCLYPLILSSLGKVGFAGAYSALFGFFCLGAAAVSVGMFISSLTENQATAAVITLVVLLLNFFLGSLSAYISSSTAASLIFFTILIVLTAVIIHHMTKNATVSVVFAIIVECALLFLKALFSTQFVGIQSRIMVELALFDKFDSFVNGIFDITAIIYYIAFSAVFVFLTVQSMEKRRWS